MSQTLLVTDLDGTLWDANLDCHPNTVAALERLTDRDGVEVLVATGRRDNSALAGLNKLPMKFPCVFLNGAHGVDYTSPNHPVFHAETFSPTLARALVSALDERDISPVLYLTDGSVRGIAQPSTHPRHLANVQSDWVVDDPLTLAASGQVMAMKMIGLPHEQLAEVAQDSADLGAELAFATDRLFGNWTLSMRPSGISKRRGIEAWIAHSGVQPSRIVAVGDGDNDVEMLAYADLAIGIESGHDAAKAEADHIIEGPGIGGWAAILDLI